MKILLKGLSNIALNKFIPAITSDCKIEITGVVTKQKVNKELIEKKYGIKVYKNIDEALTFNKADSVYISSKNCDHKEDTMKCLEKNLHCLVEKPMTWDLKSFEEIKKESENRGLCILECFQFQWHKRFKRIREYVNRNELGEINNVNIRFGCPIFNHGSNYRFTKGKGSGATLDQGCYFAKIIQLLGCGREIDVVYRGSKRKDVDVTGNIFVWDRETKTSYTGAWGFGLEYENSIDVWGSKGRIRADRIFTPPPQERMEYIIYRGSTEKRIGERDDAIKNQINHFYKMIKYPEVREMETINATQYNWIYAKMIEEAKKQALC